MKNLVLYIHGRGGSAEECEHYRGLFPGAEVIGLEYQGSTPWEAGEEIFRAVTDFSGKFESITLVANSIGAFFSMCASIDAMICRAYFISPVVDMERLILDTMARAHVTEAELQEKGTIPIPFGEDLSWDYLSYVREHPIRWRVPTRILYGGRAVLISRETMAAFAAEHGALLTVMEQGEHWFHTPEQMEFLDRWIVEGENGSASMN